MSSQRIAQDSPYMAGRLREYGRRPTYERRPIVVSPRPRQISDFLVASPSTLSLVALPAPQKQSQPSPPTEQQTKILTHQPQIRQTKAVEPDSSPKSEPKQKRNFSRMNIISVSLIIVLFAIGSGVALLQLRTNKHVAAQVQQAATNNSDSGDGDNPPDETKPNNLGAYTVPPDQPRYLSISKLSVHARVRRLGVKANNELQAPNNIYDTGWYEDSAKPGDAGGAILIDGHVHGPNIPGVFYGLKTLKAGDNIQIERGDGLKYNFKVVKLQTYDVDKVDMAAALTPIIPGKLGLNLITCAGQLDQTGNHYEQRLVVFATAE